jgi:hypothetical protein
MPVGEKRKHTRVRIQSMDVKCAVRFDTEVSLLNISQSGACISLTKPLVMGKEYALHIETEGKTHSINGIVIWERIAGSEKNVKSEILPCYEVGLSFKGVYTEQGKELFHLIEDNVVPKPSRVRLKGLRVKVLKPGMSTHVEDFSNYRIIRISESGMGIETDQTFDPDNKFRMELMLPGEKRPVQFVGRVASCLKISERIPVSFDTGIEFLEMSTEDQSLLKKFITSIRKF